MKAQTRMAWIGGFVVGFLLLAVGVVAALGGGDLFEGRDTFVLYFEEPLDGLQIGSPVLWRGVKIGLVTDFSVNCEADTYELSTPVYIELIHGRIKSVAADHAPLVGESLQKLIGMGLRASLSSTSILTGQVGVTLDFHPNSEVRLVGGDAKHVELPTVKSSGFGSLIEDARSALQGLSELTRSDDLARAIRTLGDALEEHRKLAVTLNEKVGPLLDDIKSTSVSLRRAFDDIHETSVSTRDLVGDVKQTSGSVRSTFEQAERSLLTLEEEITATLRDWSKLGRTAEVEIRTVSEELQVTLGRARSALDEVRTTMKTIGDLTAEDSVTVTNLNVALREFAHAVRAVERLAKTLERKPESIIRGK